MDDTYTIQVHKHLGQMSVYWPSDEDDYDGNDAAIIKHPSPVYLELRGLLERIRAGER